MQLFYNIELWWHIHVGPLVHPPDRFSEPAVNPIGCYVANVKTLTVVLGQT